MYEERLTSQEMPKWKEILLWIVLLPGAFLGSTLAYWAARLFNWLGSSVSGDSTWWQLISGEILTNGVAGWAWVYSSSFIAPRYKKITAICFAAVLLFLSGIPAMRRISAQDWMGLLGTLSFTAGGIIVAVYISKGEIET